MGRRPQTDGEPGPSGARPRRPAGSRRRLPRPHPESPSPRFLPPDTASPAFKRNPKGTARGNSLRGQSRHPGQSRRGAGAGTSDRECKFSVTNALRAPMGEKKKGDIQEQVGDLMKGMETLRKNQREMK